MFVMSQDDDESVDLNRGNSLSHLSYREKRREAHTQAEQKRRNAIKQGYDVLQDLVPACQKPSDGLFVTHKCNKATILQKSIEHIQCLEAEKERENRDLDMLRREMIALQIVHQNLEQMITAQRVRRDSHEKHLNEEITFTVFQFIMDQLFEMFEQMSMLNFSDIATNVFNWLEKCLKPQKFKQLVMQSLQKHNSFLMTNYQN